MKVLCCDVIALKKMSRTLLTPDPMICAVMFYREIQLFLCSNKENQQ